MPGALTPLRVTQAAVQFAQHPQIQASTVWSGMFLNSGLRNETRVRPRYLEGIMPWIYIPPDIPWRVSGVLLHPGMGVRSGRTWRTPRSRVECGHLVCTLSHFSHARHFMPPWTVARQAPLSGGILKAGMLEWVAGPSSMGSSQPRDQTCVSYVYPMGRWVLYRERHL